MQQSEVWECETRCATGLAEGGSRCRQFLRITAACIQLAVIGTSGQKAAHTAQHCMHVHVHHSPSTALLHALPSWMCLLPVL
jgi:hypothetical protein